MSKVCNTMSERSFTTSRLTTALLLVGACLAACSSLESRLETDHAPLDPQDASNTPDAVPRNEPLSRYGNPESYKVYGTTYYTLPSSKGYREQGTASWYGTKFQGKRTSSGEPYDLYAMTAAHKTLPLPTYVEVTNLNNGRAVIVKVNDRGPFHDNRLIDLSYAAATRLDILPTGTGQVEIRAIDPDEMATAVTPADTATARVQLNESLYLQVGAFSSRDNAERLRNDLLSQNLGGIRIVEATTDAGTFFKVQVGPLASHMEANRVTQELRTLGINHSHSIVQ
ncbi:MAG: septal ring lytic transglycosylase RlpA family protein [Pseudomonadota bacterium]